MKCSDAICDRQAVAKGMCQKHYTRSRKKLFPKQAIGSKRHCGCHGSPLWKNGMTVVTCHKCGKQRWANSADIEALINRTERTMVEEILTPEEREHYERARNVLACSKDGPSPITLGTCIQRLMTALAAAEQALDTERRKGSEICLEWNSKLEAAERERDEAKRKLEAQYGLNGEYCQRALAAEREVERLREAFKLIRDKWVPALRRDSLEADKTLCNAESIFGVIVRVLAALPSADGGK